MFEIKTQAKAVVAEAKKVAARAEVARAKAAAAEAAKAEAQKSDGASFLDLTTLSAYHLKLMCRPLRKDIVSSLKIKSF